MTITKTKIVVFTENFSYSVRKGIAEIDNAIPHLLWLIILNVPKRKRTQILRNQWTNLHRNGWRWIPYQAKNIWQQLPTRLINTNSSPAPGQEFNSSSLTARGNIRVLTVSDIHADATQEAVNAFSPDIGLSLDAPILRRSLFSIPKLGTLNLHKGKVPDYRGMPPAFWELWNNETSVGCTVHWVDENLNTGPTVRETTIERDQYSTVRGLQLRLGEVGVDLMREAVQGVLEGTQQATAQASGGNTYRKPTLAQTTALERNLLRNQTANIPTVKRFLKTAISVSGFKAWKLGLSRIVNPRITVLLYHRVTDEVRDNLTVGVEQFDRQMAILRKHCHVLSIEEVIASEKVSVSEAPLVCVTFDDGYLDNYTNAAQILLRHQIPAAFFVSTGIISTDHMFPHDVKRGNSTIPVMDWHHLQKMRDYGFTIGSHSVSHIDCASESVDVVSAELSQSLNDLRRNLSLRDVLFAYPYGGRKHMTPQRLELVKQAGYAGCLSAYGGANIGKIDRFNVLRRGIHWEFSDDDFLFASLGLT